MAARSRTLQVVLIAERQQLILDRLLRDGRVVVEEVATDLDLSRDTVRRDLRELEGAGQLRTVRGGAVPAGPAPAEAQQRRSIRVEEKRELAHAAAALLPTVGVVFLDSGTTNLAIAGALPPTSELTVVTNSPAIAAELVPHSHVEVIMLGGPVRRDVEACVSKSAHDFLQALRADVAVLGICGFDAEAGGGATLFEEAEFKRALVARADRVLVPLTADKVGKVAPWPVVATGEVHTLVVDASVPDAELAAFRARGVDVHRAP